MIEGLIGWAWLNVLHGVVAWAVLAAWMRFLKLPHGRSRRIVLLLVLALPPATALFGSNAGILDGRLLLWFPGPFSLRGWQLVLVVATVVTTISAMQEVLPLFRRPRVGEGQVPREVEERIEKVLGPDVETIEIDDEALLVHTEGTAERPRLVISRGAVERWPDDRLEVVIEHELAHWRGRRWLFSHVAWLLRLVQLHSPAALWAFRELMVEQEILCDADAAAGGRARPLAKALLEIHNEAGSRAQRSVLERRIEVLIGRHSINDEALPMTTLCAAVIVLVGCLRWVG